MNMYKFSNKQRNMPSTKDSIKNERKSVNHKKKKFVLYNASHKLHTHALIGSRIYHLKGWEDDRLWVPKSSTLKVLHLRQNDASFFYLSSSSQQLQQPIIPYVYISSLCINFSYWRFFCCSIQNTHYFYMLRVL